jgi:hypothetical protein
VSVIDQLFLFLIGSRRYDVLPVTSVEGLVFIAPDNDADHHWWAAVDSDCCPWPEVYSGGDFDDAILLPAIPPPTVNRRKKRQRPDASDSDSLASNTSDNDSNESESDDNNTDDGLSETEADYDSEPVDDTAPVEIAVNFEFSVQDIAAA